MVYAASGSSDVKACTAFHGSFGNLPPFTSNITSYVHVFAGGNDGLHGDPTTLEAYLDERTESTGGWEITRYAGLGHGFTAWESPDYNEIGDIRSWDSMYAAFELAMMTPVKVTDVTMSPTTSPTAMPVMTTPAPTTSKTIADIAGEVPELSNLVGAAAKAGLVDALAGPGPMTVFAPTNMAFGAVAAVEPELANAFFMFDSWNFHLADVLTYHVINGTAILSTDLVDGDVTMLNGGTMTVATNPVSFTDELSMESTVVPELFDVVASNGVVHVTDGVFLPAWVGTDIVDVAVDAGSFGTVLALATQVGLDSVLKGFGETGEGYTLFAPVDAAFEGIDAGSLTDEQITNILLDHVVVGPLPSMDVVGSTMIETARGAMLEVVVNESGVTIGGAALMTDMLDIKAKNGLIHVLSEVILVSETPAPSASPTPLLDLGDDGMGDDADDDGDDDSASLASFMAGVLVTALVSMLM